ncbi:MAG: DUF4139 domain-containing protein [Bacteroidia bacterium]
MKLMPAFCLTLILGSFSISPVNAQSISTRSVSIFKNGTAFFVKSGEVTPTDKTWTLEGENIPAARFGTLWFSGPELTSVSGGKEEVAITRDATQIAEIMSANIGKQVNIVTKEKIPFLGKIIAAGGTFVSLQNQTAYETILLSEITGFSFTEAPKMTVTDKTYQQRLQLGFSSSKPAQNIQMMYLEKGLGWFPSYMIELTGETTARLTMKAEIVNDAEDITNAEVNFVAGVPNFYAQEVLSPVAASQSLNDLLNSLNYLGPERRDMTFSNAMMNQSISYSFESPDDIGGGAQAAAEGSEQEDLYFYTLSNFSLAKGKRGIFDIMKMEIPVAHIYEVNLQPNEEGRNYYEIPVAQEKNEVIHQIKITNSGKQPLTTGTAMIVKKDGDIPLAQDLLHYTPAGGFSLVKITSAPDVKVSHKEEESGREENQTRKNRINYDKVSVSGEITVKNYKSKSIDINIRRAITGELKNSNADWLKAKRVSINPRVNETTDVCWEINLKAGEEKVIKYSYQVYVAN